jgi:TonB family protein
MTCFLKRVLPFVLTLALGLMLGKLFAPPTLRSARVVLMPQQQSVSVLEQQSASMDEGRYFKPSEVDRKARILARAEPQYTEEARKEAVTGTVVLRAVFSASGEVTNIRVVSGLPYGLTENAVDAARRIEFSPAMKDGRPVSQYIQIEYDFSLF